MYGPRGNLQTILTNIYLHNRQESATERIRVSSINRSQEEEVLLLTSHMKSNTNSTNGSMMGSSSQEPNNNCNSCQDSKVSSSTTTNKQTAMLTSMIHDKDTKHSTLSTASSTTGSIKKRRRITNNSSCNENVNSSSLAISSKKAKLSFLFLACLALIPDINGELPSINNNNNNWDRPLGMPKITQLEVMCGAQHMEVHLTFDAPFHGLVASKGMYGHQGCVYVPPRTGRSNFVFNIYYDKCGTKPDNHGKFYENTVVVQYDEELIEAWDEAKRLRCEWFNDYEKTATKTSPMVISDLDIVELNFHGDNVDCWMEIQEGKGPWAPPLNGIVPLGSPLTMVVAVKDPTGEFDMRVKACEASDGHGGHVLPLSDPEGCIVRPKLLGRFSKVKLDDGRATVLTYAYISAFKFPDMLNVHLRCTVEICRHGCPDHCASKHAPLPNKGYEGNRLEGQHTILEPMAQQSQNHEQIAANNNNQLNDLAFEEKPKPHTQEDLQLVNLPLPLGSGEINFNPHLLNQQMAEPSVNMKPPPPPLPAQQQQHLPQGFPIHQNPHFPGPQQNLNNRPFPNRQPQFQQQQRPGPPIHPQQQRQPMLPQGFPRPHPSHGMRPPPPPPQQGQQQQFPPRPFMKQPHHQGGPPPQHQQRFPPPHLLQDGRPANLGGSSIELIPSHSTEIREELVNPRNNNNGQQFEGGSSSPRPEQQQENDEPVSQEREAMMAAESNNQPINENPNRQGHQFDEPQNPGVSAEQDDQETISVSNFPKGPRNLRVRRSVDSSSDVIGVQGAFKVISQADLDFVLNSTSSNEFSTSSSPVLRGRMTRPEEAIYGICLPKVGFGVVFFGLGFATLVAILIAAFLAYARYRIILHGSNNHHHSYSSEPCSNNSMTHHSLSPISYHEPPPSFPMVILRKMW